jgi:hypothetical protein
MTEEHKNMTMIGYLVRTSPEYQKRCLDLWLKYASAIKAAEELGINHNTVRYHAWRYVLFHPDECRKYIDNLSEEDTRYYRKMTDEEYLRILTVKAIRYLTIKPFTQFVVDNKLWNYPKIYELFKHRFPSVYKQNLDKVQA